MLGRGRSRLYNIISLLFITLSIVVIIVVVSQII